MTERPRTYEGMVEAVRAEERWHPIAYAPDPDGTVEVDAL